MFTCRNICWLPSEEPNLLFNVVLSIDSIKILTLVVSLSLIYTASHDNTESVPDCVLLDHDPTTLLENQHCCATRAELVAWDVFLNMQTRYVILWLSLLHDYWLSPLRKKISTPIYINIENVYMSNVADFWGIQLICEIPSHSSRALAQILTRLSLSFFFLQWKFQKCRALFSWVE